MNTGSTARLGACARSAVLMLAMAGATAWAAVCHVNASASGANNGSNWANAYTDLQSALTSASCTGTGNEIWVAQGVYKPTPSTTDREAAFHIGADTQLYGGFAGSETAREQRNPRTHVTVLSGDIDGNDDVDAHGVTVVARFDASGNPLAGNQLNGSNSYHVVVMGGTADEGNAVITATTVFDGFTITGGQANGSGVLPRLGGGLLCNGSGASWECSPSLSQVSFSGNSALHYGGAMYNNGANGGTSSPRLSQVTFSGKSAGLIGGAMYSNGIFGGTSSPSLSHVTFSRNSAGYFGGAMYNAGSGATSSPVIQHSILWGDSASDSGAEISNNGANPTISHSIV